MRGEKGGFGEEGGSDDRKKGEDEVKKKVWEGYGENSSDVGQ